MQNERSGFPEAVICGVLSIMIAAYATYFSVYQCRRHRFFWTGLDLVSLEQPLWNTLHGTFMRATYYPVTGDDVHEFPDVASESLFSDHLQPSLIALLPIYALLPRSETIIVMMCVVVALGALPLFRIARRRLESSHAAVLLALLYLLLPMLETLSAWDPHITVFLPTLMLAAFDALENGKPRWGWLWSMLAMGCREDVPLLFGWALLWVLPRERRRYAYPIAFLGLLWTAWAFLVAAPAFDQVGSHYLVRYFPLGTEMTGERIQQILTNPSYWTQGLISLVKYNLRLGVPLLFLYVLFPPSLVAMAPVIVMNGLSWYEPMQFPGLWHYSAPLVAWSMIGVVEGFRLAEIKLRCGRLGHRALNYVGVALVAAVLATHAMQGYTPLSRSFTWPKPTGAEASRTAFINKVPTDGAVSAETHLGAHLAQRSTLRFFPDRRGAEWILVDLWFGSYHYLTHLEGWHQVLTAPGWETVSSQNGLVLLRRGSGPPDDPIAAFQDFDVAPLPPMEVHFGAPDSALRLMGAARYPKDGTRCALCTEWQITERVEYIPSIDIGGTRVPFDSVAYAPSVWATPGRMRECTQYASSAACLQVCVCELADPTDCLRVHVAHSGVSNEARVRGDCLELCFP